MKTEKNFFILCISPLFTTNAYDINQAEHTLNNVTK